MPMRHSLSQVVRACSPIGPIGTTGGTVDDMIMSVVRHPIRAKYADQWPELSAAFTTATRAEPGNLCFDWFRSVEDPNLYLLVEMFRDRAAGDAHVSSEHFAAAMGQM